MGVFAVYDTAEIQNYIFSSNKLSENVGASKLVTKLLREVLPGIIQENGGRIDWEKRQNATLDPDKSSEVVYYGGGNSYVAFGDESVFNAVTEEFLRETYRLTHTVGIAVAAVETAFGDTYRADYGRLNERLRLTKGNINRPIPAGNQPITRQSTRTGLPVVGTDRNEWVDRAQLLKREADEERRDFDILGSYMGIVHIDGNNMRYDIAKYIENADTYKSAVPLMRGLAKRIDETFQNARDAVNKPFRAENIPCIELVKDGDDTTVVLPGEYAICYAAALLRGIESGPSPFGENGAKPTACAGVAIVHNHFPFSSAYTLAEEACGSAKKPSRDNPGSYIDFHLHQSGTVLSLSALRERQYTVGGTKRFARPWKISGAADVPCFEWFEKNGRDWIKQSTSWPRNRLKDLRNALGSGDEEARLVIAQCESRGYKLPGYDESKLSWYFDVLELADKFAEVEVK
jgi:hypothetical protein